MIRGELANWTRVCVTTLYSVDPSWDPDHDAAMRVGGEAPGRQSHSQKRHRSQGILREPPPRIVIGVSSCGATSAETVDFSHNLSLSHDALRRMTPCGTSPVVTNRHSAMSSLRASATIMVLRFLPAAMFCRYHCAKALSFWWNRKRHASWIMPRRTRALPALASPFSRRRRPLSSGEPVSPAYRATAR